MLVKAAWTTDSVPALSTAMMEKSVTPVFEMAAFGIKAGAVPATRKSVSIALAINSSYMCHLHLSVLKSGSDGSMVAEEFNIMVEAAATGGVALQLLYPVLSHVNTHR